MGDLEIVMDKKLADVDLLMQNESSLPEAMRQLNLCDAFVAVRNGRALAVCLLAKRKGFFDVVNLAVDELSRDSGVEKELILYVLDYTRAQGGRMVEIGAGDAELSRHELLIRLGFRVVGIWRGHYQDSGRPDSLWDGIPNRDMLRYSIDLNESYDMA